MNLLYSVLLGLVQGISEWLPISSKTQVLFASYVLFGLPLAAAYAFGLFLEIGSLGSAIIYFRKDIIALFHDRKLFMYLFVVTIFTAIVGAPLYYITDTYLQHTSPFIGIPMIALGLSFIGIGLYIRYSRALPKIAGHEQMKIKALHRSWNCSGNSSPPRSQQIRNDSLDNARNGRKTISSIQVVLSGVHSGIVGAFGVSILFSRDEINTDIQAVSPLGLIVSIITALLIGLVTICTCSNLQRQKTSGARHGFGGTLP